jgi:hypothetical protein
MRCSMRKASITLALIAVLPGVALAATYYPRIFDTKRGGSVCYYRTYSDAFLKKHPDVKLTAITIERRSSIPSGAANSKKKFGVAIGATTKTESYVADGSCRTQGSVLSCKLEADGGTFTVMRSGKGVIIKTRKISMDGFYKDLVISSKKGKPTRSFTLKGSGKETCEAVFD